MKNSKIKVYIVATLTVHGIPQMTKTGREEVCLWLARRTEEILNRPQAFGRIFRARYLCDSRKK